jgi:uncharacterized membrane protein YdcZ (DUF606 family)
MRWMLLATVRVIAYVLVAYALVVSIRLRFDHPELTETQLMLMFWREWLFYGGLCGAALVALTLLRTRAK